MKTFVGLAFDEVRVCRSEARGASEANASPMPDSRIGRARTLGESRDEIERGTVTGKKRVDPDLPVLEAALEGVASHELRVYAAHLDDFQTTLLCAQLPKRMSRRVLVLAVALDVHRSGKPLLPAASKLLRRSSSENAEEPMSKSGIVVAVFEPVVAVPERDHGIVARNVASGSTPGSSRRGRALRRRCRTRGARSAPRKFE